MHFWSRDLIAPDYGETHFNIYTYVYNATQPRVFRDYAPFKYGWYSRGNLTFEIILALFMHSSHRHIPL